MPFQNFESRNFRLWLKAYSMGRTPRLCRGGSRSLTFTGVAPFCVFPYFSQKRYMHERRPYGTPDEFLVSPTPRLSAGLTTTAPTARATGCCLHGALLHRPL